MKTTTAAPSPGPWTVEAWKYAGEPDRIKIISQARRKVIATVSHDNGTGNPYAVPRDEAEANARIIAAALAMLEALIDVQKEIRAAFKLDVKKHYSLMVAMAAAQQIIHETTTTTQEGQQP